MALAIRRAGLTAEDAGSACPGGIRTLTAEFHGHGDREMIRALDQMTLTAMPFPSRIAEAVWQRSLAYADRRLAMRALIAHFALPMHCGEGARLTWQTADTIWNHFGHTRRDFSWSTKRLTLATVLGSTTLYLVGDTSEGLQETRGFIERRIADVMRIESVKAKVRDNRGLESIATTLSRVSQQIRTAAESRSGSRR